MKKQIITLALFLSLCLSAWAQKEYKIMKPAGKLILNLHGALIEGYDGNEIIFTSQRAPEEEDERAKGLQALSSSGFIDNTGMGISVTEKGQDVEVNLIGNNKRGEALRIRVPKQVALVFNNNKSIFTDTLHIKNMRGEIEVSTSYNNVVLETNSGPMNIKTVYRDVEATFANNVKGPISIISVYGHVDVALPEATKANLTLGTSYGKLYAAEDFNIAMTPKAEEKDDEVRAIGASTISAGEGRTAMIIPATPTAPGSLEAVTVTGFAYRGGEQESIEGTINGGGIDLILKSTYKNVYLRTP
ncbi:DUF4097 family beta strand repeat-containing protein [Parapedobacter pyrenivorans]|uniref:DUF4097 family beta strand repeat-containing protein n=1 Tax=Parapedobacter pyrenivorans TaxID=1305674 RepID=UPI003341183D